MASSPIRLCTPGFEVRNRKTLGSLRLGRTWPIISILASRGPTHQDLGSLGGDFEPKPLKPPSHAFVPCTQVGAPRWHPASPVHRSRLAVHRRTYTTVAEPPLRVPNSHGRPTPSIASSPSEGFCPSPSGSSSPTSGPLEGLLSIGGLELVDNYSSHQESNEAGPLALTLVPDPEQNQMPHP